MSLTEKIVRDARGGEKVRIIWDGEVKGLGLHVSKAGTRTFIFNYRSGGKESRLKIGRVGEYSLAEARDEARRHRIAVTKGRDPQAERVAYCKRPTVSDAIDRFLGEHLPARMAIGKLAPSTAAEYRRQAEKHIRPKLGRVRVDEVKREDTERMAAGLAPILRNRVLALAHSLFRLVEVWGWRPQHSNPAFKIDKASEDARDRTLSAEEIGRLGRALDIITADAGAILAIRIAALTGLRIGEVLAMRWTDLDLSDGVVVLPETKTGRRLHTLPTAALALLADAPRLGAQVIPGRDLHRPLSYSVVRKAFARACDQAGIEGARLHDLRRTIITQAAASGVSAHLLRDMLGHKTAAMADRYIRRANASLRDLREQAGASMAAQLAGGAVADVVPIEKVGRRC